MDAVQQLEERRKKLEMLKREKDQRIKEMLEF
jgi:hypothetical protein